MKNPRFKVAWLGFVTALTLIGAALLPALPGASNMASSSGDDMTVHCPTCHLAPECASVCTLLPSVYRPSTSQFDQERANIESGASLDWFAALLPKPPPRNSLA